MMEGTMRSYRVTMSTEQTVWVSAESEFEAVEYAEHLFKRYSAVALSVELAA